MKAFLLPFALLACAAAPALAQMQPPPPTRAERAMSSGEEMSAPFKGANALIITMPDSGEAAAQSVMSALLRRGYSMKSTDGKFLTFATNDKMINANLHTALFGQIQGRTLRLAGTLSIKLLELTGAPIVYRGTSGTWGAAWLQVEAVAKELGGKVAYRKN